MMNHVMKAKFKAMMLFFVAALTSAITGCGNMDQVQLGEANVPAEIGNQLGDVMASIDDAGKGSVTIAGYEALLNRYNNKSSVQQVALQNAMNLFIPKAEAATCGSSQFGSCSSNTMIKNFNGCTIGGYTLNGTVSMSWTGGSGCSLSAQSQTIRITPNYTVAGNNMTLTATKTGTYGVTLTLTTSATTKVWSYTNDGINRTLAYNGTTLMDLDTRTNSALTVTGSSRGNRTLSSSAGALEVVNNTTNESCTFQANALSWASSTCNCATSGSWSGTCSTLGTFTMNITGCGTATVNYTSNGATEQKTVSLDRCVAN